MKRILSLFCIFSMLFTITGCTFQTYSIDYDDATVYVTPKTKAKPGDMVSVVVNTPEGADFFLYVNGYELSPHKQNATQLTYEFMMPYNDVYITHDIKEFPDMNDIRIPASMQCLRISYSTEFAFSGKYVIVRNMQEADALFAGFSLAYAENIQTYPENFFENNLIVAFLQHEGSGSVSHSLDCVTFKDGVLTITINRHVPSIGTCDMASWLCVTAISKQALPDMFGVEIISQEKGV